MNSLGVPMRNGQTLTGKKADRARKAVLPSVQSPKVTPNQCEEQA